MKRFSAGLVLMLLCTFSIFAQNKVISPQSKSRKICVESFLYWIPNQARTGTIIC